MNFRRRSGRGSSCGVILYTANPPSTTKKSTISDHLSSHQKFIHCSHWLFTRDLDHCSQPFYFVRCCPLFSFSLSRPRWFSFGARASRSESKKFSRIVVHQSRTSLDLRKTEVYITLKLKRNGLVTSNPKARNSVL